MGSVMKLMGRMAANKLFKLDVLRDKNNTDVNHGDDMFLMWSAEALGLVQRWTPEDMKGNTSNISPFCMFFFYSQ